MGHLLPSFLSMNKEHIMSVLCHSLCTYEMSKLYMPLVNMVSFTTRQRILVLPRVEISRASYEPLGDVEAHLKHFKPRQPL